MAGYQKKPTGNTYYLHMQVNKGSKEDRLLQSLIDQLDFVGNRCEITISKAFAIIAPALVQNFSNTRKIQTDRMTNSPALFFSQNWKTTDDPEGLRELTVQSYIERVKAFPWNKDLTLQQNPIVPVVHGTGESVAWKIASGGFAALSTLDAGFYGKGIYFSSHALYTVPYFATNPEPVVLICLTIPGNPRPIIEHPQGKENFLGKPISGGYQSHYVLTKKNGFPLTSKPDTNKNVYDELIIHAEAQVVPIFLLMVDKSNIAKLVQEYQRDIVLPDGDIVPPSINQDQTALLEEKKDKGTRGNKLTDRSATSEEKKDKGRRDIKLTDRSATSEEKKDKGRRDIKLTDQTATLEEKKDKGRTDINLAE